MNVETILKDITGVVAVVTLMKGVYEYMMQRSDKRAQQFLEMRKSFRENKEFQKILEHLHGDQDFSQISDTVKFEFMGFFEDLAFLINSKLMKKETVFYMFSFDVIAAWNNSLFWDDELKNDKYWSLLSDFVNQMMEIDKNFIYDRKLIRL